MTQSVNSPRHLHSRLVVLITILALLLTACHATRPLSAASIRLETPTLNPPQVTTSSLISTISTTDLRLSNTVRPVSILDTCSNLALRLFQVSPDSFRVEAFSFHVTPFHLGPMSFEATMPAHEPDPLGWKRCLLWFGALACLVILLRR